MGILKLLTREDPLNYKTLDEIYYNAREMLLEVA